MTKIIPLLRFKFIRLLERICRPDTLYRLLLPLAVLRAAFKKSTAPQRLPAPVGRGMVAPGNAKSQAGYRQNAVLTFFPDRLRNPAWLSRCSFSGIDRLQDCQRRGQPVILATAHFGPVFLLSRWLQAAGIRSATLVSGRTDERSYLNRLKDRATLFPEIPRVFFPHQLRELTKFLAAGNVLVIAIDSPRGNQIKVPLDARHHFRLATGPIRLAARHGARLFPCTILDEGRWRFRFELGHPVPAEFLSDPSDLASAGNFLASELLPCFAAQPEQCSKMVLACFETAGTGSAPGIKPDETALLTSAPGNHEP